MALDKFLFKITPAPTGGNSSAIEWSAYLDEEQRNIIIWDATEGVEVCRIGSSSGMMELVGGYDASGNTYPTIGSGTADAVQKGDSYIVTVAGTLGGTLVAIGDILIATIDAPGQTAGNWAIENKGIGYTPENTANKATGFGTVNNVKFPTTAATEARYAKSLAEQIASVGNVGGGEDDLFTNTLVVNQFAANGDKIRYTAGLTLANNVNAKVIKGYFAGTAVIDSTGLDLASIAGQVSVEFTVIRTGVATARVIAKLLVSPTLSVIKQTDIAGLDWAAVKIAKLTGTGVADNDIVAKVGDIMFIPAAA